MSNKPRKSKPCNRTSSPTANAVTSLRSAAIKTPHSASMQDPNGWQHLLPKTTETAKQMVPYDVMMVAPDGRAWKNLQDHMLWSIIFAVGAAIADGYTEGNLTMYCKHSEWPDWGEPEETHTVDEWCRMYNIKK